MTSPDTVTLTLHQAATQLEQAGIESARLDASLLLAHVLGRPREVILLNPGIVLNDVQKTHFNELLVRRRQHEPLAYITGIKEFWGLDFCVTRDTLIPRPDSETLVEAALKRVKNRAGHMTILDMGTGTGCLLIALLKELPKAAGVGVDINERALQVAQENAQRHKVHERTQFLYSDWCDALNGTFDLIISNPPYIAEADRLTLMRDVVDYEPQTALFAGNDGLDAYRKLAVQLPRFLHDDGLILLEGGVHQAEAVNGLLQAQGLLTEKPRRDLAGVERCVIARKPEYYNKH